jgi:hypothetical protein
VTLLLGTILISERFRLTFPIWHRRLGRIEVICVLFLVAPSGLWMSRYAETGQIAAAGFAVLAMVTGFCAAIGWRSALKRQFVEHRRWMWRCFLLLCSAVVLRLMAGLATVANVESEWVYPMSAWASWILPLVAFELSDLRKRQ